MKIVADENMPLVHELFAGFGDVVSLPGRSISARDVADADVLLIRSVTRVNRQLLAGSRVRFIGSATIGTDHIDCQYLAEQGIAFANAPGCNANAVVDYVLAAFFALDINLAAVSVGIIGCGNVGGRLYRRLRQLDVACRCYDPFLSVEQQPDLMSLEAVLQADVVSLHTPLTKTGPHPSWHLLNAGNLSTLPEGGVLINSGRGAVINNRDLSQLLMQRKDLRVVLDVWEHEPLLDMTLLNQVSLATPHIAGYSVQGKENGTRMVHRAFLSWLGREPEPKTDNVPALSLSADSVRQAVLSACDIGADDRRLRSALAAASNRRGEVFDDLRKHYPHREEFSRYRVTGTLGKDEKA